jgi:hypothetical protein
LGPFTDTCTVLMLRAFLGHQRTAAPQLLGDAGMRGDRYRPRRHARADVEALALAVYESRLH